MLTELLRNLHERSLRFWFISLNAPTQYQLVQDEHATILEAIRRRDADKADAAMRRHIESFRKNVLPIPIGCCKLRVAIAEREQ